MCLTVLDDNSAKGRMHQTMTKFKTSGALVTTAQSLHPFHFVENMGT